MNPSRWTSLFVFGLFGLLMYLKFADKGPWADKPAPDFQLPFVPGEQVAKGERLTLSSTKGHPVVLDFWASWCEPCRQSIPIMNQVAKELEAEGVLVYGVNSEALNANAVSRVAARWGIGYPVLHDMAATVMATYGVSALPTLFLIDRQGIVRRTHAGAPSAEQLIREVREMDR